MNRDFFLGKGFDGEGPGRVLIDSIGGMRQGAAIEAQEARGQAALVHADVFPKDMQSPREDYEALGFVFGEDADDIFLKCTFPPGWTKRASDHSMHTDVLDEQGRKRFGIFYKAAFYDRSAIAYSLNRRYNVHNPYCEDRKVKAVIEARDGETCLKEFVVKVTDPEKYWEAGDEATKLAKAWLDEQFPNWQDSSAYWDAPKGESV